MWRASRRLRPWRKDASAGKLARCLYLAAMHDLEKIALCDWIRSIESLVEMLLVVHPLTIASLSFTVLIAQFLVRCRSAVQHQRDEKF